MVIDSFRGKYSFLSNFYDAPVDYNGARYPTSEHAYQAQKACTLDDEGLIRNAVTPGEAKRISKRIKIRDDWEEKKVGIMLEIVYQKFKQSPELTWELLQTGDAVLIESNNWQDRFWGVCDGAGENWLGQILMAVRQQLYEESKL